MNREADSFCHVESQWHNACQVPALLMSLVESEERNSPEDTTFNYNAWDGVRHPAFTAVKFNCDVCGSSSVTFNGEYKREMHCSGLIVMCPFPFSSNVQ